MDIRESVESFSKNGISLRRIAEAAHVNKNTLVSLRKGAHVSQGTIDKIKSGLKDIALELYNIAYSDEVNNNEEWED